MLTYIIITGLFLNLIVVFYLINTNKAIQKEQNRKIEQLYNNINSLYTTNTENIVLKLQEKLNSNISPILTNNFDMILNQIQNINYKLAQFNLSIEQISKFTELFNNVKNKGILGEVLLEDLIKDIFSETQYEKNIKLKKDKNFFIEFAIKIPQENGYIYLPIDSKFAYQDKENEKILIAKIKKFAKDVAEKYINPPLTTDFAIIFIPVESIYLSFLKENIISEIYRKYKILITGPNSLYAILSSVKLSFTSFKLYQSSKQLLNILEYLKSEIPSMQDIIEKSRNKIVQINDNLQKLKNKNEKILKKLNNI